MTPKQRGRKPANLVAPRPIEVCPRQPLPPELAGDEAELYLDIVNTEEGGWFTRGNLPLLIQYCRHVIQARRLAELIDACVGRRETELPDYLSLLAAQARESSMIATLGQKMRLSQSAARNDRGHPRPVSVPWEFKQP
jgi:hypothetical protein